MADTTVRFDPLSATGLTGDAGAILAKTANRAVDAQSARDAAAAAANAPPPAPVQLSGRYVSVIGPDGTPKEVPEENLEQAKALGYSVESADQKGIRQAVEDSRGMIGTLKVGATSFANEFLLGLPELIYEKTGDPYEVAKHEAIRKDHDVASAIGGTLGFGASLFLPGLDAVSAAGKATKGAVLGTRAIEAAVAERVATQLVTEGVAKGAAEAAAPSLARRILASAAGSGVEGALISAPRAATEAALGDPEAAAESLLYGAGVGATLGGVGALGKELLGAVKAVAPSLPATEEFAQRQGYLSLNPTKKYADEIARLPGGEKAAEEVVSKYGIRRKVGQGAEDLAEQVNAARTKVGEEIGGTAKKFDELAGKKALDAQGIANRIADDVLAPLESGTGAVGKESTANRVRDWGDSFFRNTVEKEETFPFRVKKNISFEELQNIRTDLNTKIRQMGGFGANAEEKEAANAFKDIRNIIDDAYFTRATEVAEQSGEGSLIDRLKELRRDYSILKPLSKAVENNVGRYTANRTAGLSEHLTAQIGERVGSMVGGAVGSLGGGAVGSMLGVPLGAAVGGAIKREGHSVMAAAAEKFGLLFSEKAMKRTAEALDRIPTELEGVASEKKAAASDAMLSLVGLKGPGSKREAFEKVSSKLTDYSANPQKMADDIGEIAGKLADSGAPQIAQAYAIKMQQALDYLQTQIPKPAAPDLPIARAKWKPTDTQIAEFERKAAVMLDPFSVVRRVGDATLTKGEVDALKAVYPRIYDSMVERINRYAYDPERAKPMPYSQRLKLSMLTGQDLAVGMNPQAIRATQSIYQAAKEQGPTQGPSSGAQLKVPDISTESQRISNR